MKSVLKKFTVGLLCVVGVLSLFFIMFGIISEVDDSSAKKNSEEQTQNLLAKNLPVPVIRSTKNLEDMLENALQSVVGISGADYIDPSGKGQQWRMGSGVIVSEDGYIVTNHHVIGSSPEKILVTLSDGEVTEGKDVWSDASLDLAVVKINGEGYVFSKPGDAKTLRVGENVVAIGNPLGMQFQRTVTAGIVSALGRSISIGNDDGETSWMEDLIQTDASINPGNSGGPLLNSSGEVVGINTVKVSAAEGMGFAVPINVCVPVVHRLRKEGYFRTPYLGLYAYTPAAARYLDEKVDMEKGMYIAKIDTEGPAFKAGLRHGDILTTVDDVVIDSMLSLREQLYKKQAGERITVEYVRKGLKQSTEIILAQAE